MMALSFFNLHLQSTGGDGPNDQVVATQAEMEVRPISVEPGDILSYAHLDIYICKNDCVGKGEIRWNESSVR
jgi:hypothetical protein